MADINFPPANESPFQDPNGRWWDWTDTKWVMRSENTINEAPADGTPYVRQDAAWAAGVGVDPAVADKLYVRKNGGWSEVLDIGSGLPDAPADSTFYGRKDAVWVNPVVADIPGLQAAFDAKSDVGHTHPASDIPELKEMAYEDDAPDSSEYTRSKGVWVPTTPAAGIYFNDGITIMAPQDTDDGTLVFLEKAVTIRGIHAHMIGVGSSVTCNLYFGANRNLAGTTVFNTDIVINSDAGQSFLPDVAAIPINTWIWLDIVSTDLSPEMVHLTINYTQD